jgi:hypothetical protein
LSSFVDFLLVLPLIYLHSIGCFGRFWERRIWALHVLLPLNLVHRFEFSSEIRVSGSCELISLGFLEPYTAYWTLWHILGASN